MEHQDTFRESLFKTYEDNKRVLIPKEEYGTIISELLQAASVSKKTSHQYYLLKKYKVLQCGDSERLIRRRVHADEAPLYFVSIEETFDVVKRAHIATGHGGRDKMVYELTKKYANITIEALNLFKSLCLEYQKKRKRPTTKGIVVKPIISKDFNSRAQVDLIDMQSMSQGQFKWIMVYQDHLTKFCVLRPLTSKRAAEVAFQLLDIFLLLGAPCVLQSDNLFRIY
ncbi:KRAB-A domain-containing protein 2-like [Gigantopelta aegis]|uniref:KRAB-A domain-containing protein 2-like n=1 Tax=Gigantopelta aegis TaxID=1735272 RepID=UPI001B88BC17|nr:KRAB-A domain-containing protein 2-like [Gigantopelta aegis]